MLNSAGRQKQANLDTCSSEAPISPPDYSDRGNRHPYLTEQWNNLYIHSSASSVSPSLYKHLLCCFKELKPTCHGLPQSSGIGKAPSHIPTKLEIVVIWRLFSQMDVTPFLLKILSQALKFGPNKHKQGIVVKVDKITASENVSNANSISGAPYRTKITWKNKQDVRK